MSINKKNSDGSYSQFAGMPYVTKDNLGIEKVENKSSEDIRGEITSKNIKDALGYTPANDVDEKKSQNDIAVLSSRMDGFTKLGEGSTTGDAELEDIRVAYDGKTYSNAGTAVRSQVTELKETINTTNSRISNIIAQSGTSDTEVVDARHSNVSDKTYNTLVDRLDAMENYVTPEMFGAVGDGETDDANAFKAALSFALTNRKEVLILGKIYAISGDIDIAGQVVRGSGISQTTLILKDGHINVSGVGGLVSGFSIRKDAGDGYAVIADYITQSYCIENMRIYSSGNGLQIKNSWYATINNVNIILTNHTGNCLNLHATSRGGVNNLNFSGVFTQRGLHAVVIDKESNYNNENIGFYNCTFENCKGTAITSCNGTVNITIDTVYMEGIASDSTTVVALEAPSSYGCVASVRSLLVRTGGDPLPKIPMFSGNVNVESMVSMNHYTNICSIDDDVTYNKAYNLNLINGKNVGYTESKTANFLKVLTKDATTDIVDIGMVGSGARTKVKLIISGYLDGYNHIMVEKEIYITQQASGAYFVSDKSFYSTSNNYNAEMFTVIVSAGTYDDRTQSVMQRISINLANMATLTAGYRIRIEVEEIFGKSNIYTLDTNE